MKPTIVRYAVDEDFWEPPKPRRYIDWRGVVCAVMTAIAGGMLAAWVYGIIRLMQIS